MVMLAILGFIGVTGPLVEDSIFRSVWWFDKTECWTLMLVGVISIIISYAASAKLQKPVALAIGLLSILFAVWIKYIDPNFLGINIEFPIELIWYSVFGLWGVICSMIDSKK